MNAQDTLMGSAIGISVSDSPDMAPLGLSEPHLRDAMVEIARHLLARGCRLVYGGDLRPGGFTEMLLELVARHRRNDELNDERAAVVNYLAWPVITRTHRADLLNTFAELGDGADVICLSQDGNEIPWQSALRRVKQEAPWAPGLTAMRKVISEQIAARVVLGGRVEGYSGSMPGVAEESLISLKLQQPLYLLGGFGGCARDIAETIGLAAPWATRDRDWNGRSAFAQFRAGDIKNGLTVEENSILARTAHIDQALALVMRGLVKRFKR